MRRLTLVLVLVLLPSQALAECAWVLYQSVYKTKDAPEVELVEGPKMMSAYATRDECEKAALEWFRKINQDPKSLIVTFECFPDTIDPRGKKD